MRHLQAAMEMMTKRSMMKSSTMAQKRPLELTWTGFSPLKTDHISQGKGSLQTYKQHVTSSPWTFGCDSGLNLIQNDSPGQLTVLVFLSKCSQGSNIQNELLPFDFLVYYLHLDCLC